VLAGRGGRGPMVLGWGGWFPSRGSSRTRKGLVRDGFRRDFEESMVPLEGFWETLEREGIVVVCFPALARFRLRSGGCRESGFFLGRRFCGARGGFFFFDMGSG